MMLCVVPDPEDLYYFKTNKGSLLLSATANSTFYFIGSDGEEGDEGGNECSAGDEGCFARQEEEEEDAVALTSESESGSTVAPAAESAPESKKEIRRHLAEALSATPHLSSSSASLTPGGSADGTDRRIFSESSLSSGSELLSSDRKTTPAPLHQETQTSKESSISSGGSSTGGGALNFDLLRKKTSTVTVPEVPIKDDQSASSSHQNQEQPQLRREPPVVSKPLQDLADDETRVRRMKRFEYTKSLYVRPEGGCDAQRVDEVQLTLFLNERSAFSSVTPHHMTPHHTTPHHTTPHHTTPHNNA
jgi:hypothetical protein